MTKHFPGGGPQKDGEDPHFPYGREQVYPGGKFELPPEPFEAAFAAGTSQIMPYYGMPVGTEYEEVGFGFNKAVITGLLRERYGFDGIVCTDWGLLTDAEIVGEPFPARAWGVEHLTAAERVQQGRSRPASTSSAARRCPELIVELVEPGASAEARLDESARRLLREKFVLGLFDAARTSTWTRPSAIVGAAASSARPARPRSAPRSRCSNNGDGCRVRRRCRCARPQALRRGHRPPRSAAEYGEVVETPRRPTSR